VLGPFWNANTYNYRRGRRGEVKKSLINDGSVFSAVFSYLNGWATPLTKRRGGERGNRGKGRRRPGPARMIRCRRARELFIPTVAAATAGQKKKKKGS